MAGIGSLVTGFQQGYDFVDDAQRKQKDDAYKGKVRARQEKEWTKEDEYEADRQALSDRYFPKEAPVVVAPADPTAAPAIAARGVSMDAIASPVVTATPIVGGPAVAAIPVADTGKAVELPPPAAPVAGAGRGFVIPPGPTGGGRGNINPNTVTPRDTVNYSSDAGGGRGSSRGADWAQITNDSRAAQGERNADRVGILKQELANAKTPETKAILEREIANELKNPLPTTGPAPAGGKVTPTAQAGMKYLNDPANKPSILAAAEKQFGLRHRPATAEEAAFNAAGANGSLVNVAAAGPSPAPGVQLAADGVPVPVKTKPTAYDPHNALGNTLDYVTESIKLDVKHGKKDGAALLQAVKLIDTFKKEGMQDAIELMDRGDYQGAQDAFNNKGGSKGWTVVSSQPSVFQTPEGTKLPTNIVIVQNEDGTTRTINTKADLYKMIGIEKQATLAMEGRKATAQEEDTKARREDTKLNREEIATDRRERTALMERDVKTREAALGLREDKADAAEGLKLPPLVKEQVKGLQEAISENRKAIVKARADNTWDATSENGKQLLGEQRRYELQLRELIAKHSGGAGAAPTTANDPYGVNTAPPAADKAAAAPAAPAAGGAKTAAAGVAAPKPKESWSQTVADKEGQYKDAAARKAKIEADPEIVALQEKKQAAAKAGKLDEARKILAQIEEVKAKKYPGK